MKRLIVLIFTIILLFLNAFAESWFPFALSKNDDYAVAANKLITALSEMEPIRRTNYVLFEADKASFYMNELSVKEISLNQPEGFIWNLVIWFSPFDKSFENLTHVYEIYSELVSYLGEPIEVSPTKIKVKLDGTTTETNPFTDKEQFIKEILSAKPSGSFAQPTSFQANFEYGNISIQIYNEYYADLSLTFSIPIDVGQ